MMKSSGQLREEAVDYQFNKLTSLKVYLKACVGILEKAQVEFQNGDAQLAYMLYYRYVDLCTNKMSTHPEYVNKNGDPLYRQEYMQLVQLEVPAVMKLIVDLQRKLDLEFEKHQVSLAKNIARAKVTSSHQQGRNASQEKYIMLPSTFNESKFNQSMTFFHHLNENSGSQRQTSNVSQKNTNQKDKAKPIASELNTLHYPSLPQLSSPTYI